MTQITSLGGVVLKISGARGPGLTVADMVALDGKVDLASDFADAADASAAAALADAERAETAAQIALSEALAIRENGAENIVFAADGSYPPGSIGSAVKTQGQYFGLITGDALDALKTSGIHTLTAFEQDAFPAQYFASNSAVRAVPGLSRLKRDGEGTLFATIGAENLYVSGLSIDMDFTASGESGHAMSFGDCSDITLQEIRISDVGNLGGTAGSGLLAYTSGVGAVDATSYAYRIKFLNSAITADIALSDNTHGAIIEDGRYCRIDGLWTDGFRGFGQEFKHDTRYSLLVNGISGNCGYAFGYGQSETGLDGADLNVSANLISYASDQGHTIGEGRYNLTSNLLVDADGAPGVFGGGAYGAHAQVGAVGNAWMNVLTHGAMTYPVRSRGDSNTFEVISHDTAAKIASFDAGVMRNVVRVVHPGARDSISNAVTDNSGNLPGSSSGNVVYSPATGEHFGTFSGWFWKRINPYGGTFYSTQKLRFENNESLIIALGVPGTPGNLAGLAVNSAATADYAHIQYGFSASPTGEYWEFKIANATKWRMYSSTLRPSTDNDADIGSATHRAKATYAIRLYYSATVFDAYGTGSPEGALTGGVGCTYRREDGARLPHFTSRKAARATPAGGLFRMKHYCLSIGFLTSSLHLGSASKSDACDAPKSLDFQSYYRPYSHFYGGQPTHGRDNHPQQRDGSDRSLADAAPSLVYAHIYSHFWPKDAPLRARNNNQIYASNVHQTKNDGFPPAAYLSLVQSCTPVCVERRPFCVGGSEPSHLRRQNEQPRRRLRRLQPHTSYASSLSDDRSTCSVSKWVGQ